MTSSEMSYSEWLDWLGNNIGARHANLFNIVIAGRREGVDDEQIREDLLNNAGDEPLSFSEVDDAIANCDYKSNGKGRKADPEAVKAKKALDEYIASATDEDRATLEVYAADGWEWINAHPEHYSDVFAPWSPLPPNPMRKHPENDLRARYSAYNAVRAWWPKDDEGYLFATDNKKEKRDRDHIFLPTELCERIKGGFLPQHICPNTVTGESAKGSKGAVSYATGKCAFHRRWAILDFDAISPHDQAAFGIGLLMHHPNSVATITLTRNKSLHFIVRMPEPEVQYDLMGGIIEPGWKERERVWKAAWATLIRRFASNKDERKRCDHACRDAIHMTRLPGAMRWGNNDPSSTLNHALIYCNPEATEAIV